MRRNYPDFAFFPPSTGPLGETGVGIWRGTICPVGPEALSLVELLDDLDHDSPVVVALGGGLLHFDACSLQHCVHDWMDRLVKPFPTFDLEVHYAGGREHPRCFIRKPTIPLTKRLHFLADGSVCPFLASGGAWSWDRHTVSEFVDHIVIWLAKWTIWDQTQHWPGRQHTGSPTYHLANIRPSEQCWCRSGRKYHKCHMQADRRVVAASVLGRPITYHRWQAYRQPRRFPVIRAQVLHQPC